MKALDKLVCRTLQKSFRLLIPVLPYRDPDIAVSYPEMISRLQERRIKKVLIVTDSGIEQAGLVRPLQQALQKADIKSVLYNQVQANPTIENVEQAKAFYLKQDCQGMIAIGGGSSIDCAKAAGARIACPHKSVSSMEGVLKVIKPIPYLAAIPTTAGTGSEITLAAVITDSQTGHKFAMNDFRLIPDLAVLVSDNTKSLPKSLAAATGMDALTHAIEAYIGGSVTKQSRKDALEAVRLIFENLLEAWESGKEKARANMLAAAFLAGRAFSKSYVGYIHAIAHSLGGKYNIPHGLANAVIMPCVLEAYGQSIHAKLHDLAVAAGISDQNERDDLAADKLIQAIKEMNRKTEIPDKLEGIREEDIPALARHAAKEANPLYPVPVLMDAEELEKFYYQIRA